ncbi:uncharacterized protein LOC111394695 [Olea europaea var. sylvestris]|uniref:uncharacterized protein LOC111394695 n=1 Tax=Olea europaea var. sylvestris TaxID=158386 RepID=UPI000C1D8754|nr:uncharacterized protein LOC111394695 [Olea europaea var. sylvestris]XP_022876408.1 uncharacterized protein LOC111394695 [Olea europaea var. sylvestris]
MEPSTFGTRTTNRGLRLCQGAVSPSLQHFQQRWLHFYAYSVVMIGARVQKITIRQQQNHISTCIYHRRLKSKANQGLEQEVESESCHPSLEKGNLEMWPNLKGGFEMSLLLKTSKMATFLCKMS